MVSPYNPCLYRANNWGTDSWTFYYWATPPLLPEPPNRYGYLTSMTFYWSDLLAN